MHWSSAPVIYFSKLFILSGAMAPYDVKSTAEYAATCLLHLTSIPHHDTDLNISYITFIKVILLDTPTMILADEPDHHLYIVSYVQGCGPCLLHSSPIASLEVRTPSLQYRGWLLCIPVMLINSRTASTISAPEEHGI